MESKENKIERFVKPKGQVVCILNWEQFFHLCALTCITSEPCCPLSKGKKKCKDPVNCQENLKAFFKEHRFNSDGKEAFTMYETNYDGCFYNNYDQIDFSKKK